MSGTTRKAPAYKPRELDEYPAVEAFLQRLELGVFHRDTLVAPVGRNDCWAGDTTTGDKVFVKRLVGGHSNVQHRMSRLRSFELLASRLPSTALRGPRVLGFDEDAGLVAFAYLAGAESGSALMVEETFSERLAGQVGAAIGVLHSAERLVDPDGMDTSLPGHPSEQLLTGIPLAMYEGLSFGETQAWGLMQRDEELVEGVRELLRQEREAPRVPAHCDFRVDQLLVLGEDFLITDWEEFRLADPARDVGSFVGEWLYRSVLDIVSTRGDSSLLDIEITHDTVVRRGVEKLHRLTPLTRAFWRAYRSERPGADEGLARRATAFAGWHTLDRLLAGAQRTARLSGIQRAAAGIGRRALLEPDRFAEVLGLSEVLEETP